MKIGREGGTHLQSVLGYFPPSPSNRQGVETMEQRPLYIASCSFGKDSIATILLALEHNEPLDRCVFAEVMFDAERNISGEIPEHIEWIYLTAIPKLEAMGVKVDVVRTKDYLSFFHRRRGEKSKPEYRGRKEGFVIGGKCRLSGQKAEAIKRYYKDLGTPAVVQYIGIAIDEPKRLQRLEGTNNVSLLAKYGFTEADAWRKCEEYGLLSPIYDTESRGGCWFCPNASNKHFMRIYTRFPHLWNELRIMSKDENLCTQCFKYNQRFGEYEAYIERRLR